MRKKKLTKAQSKKLWLEVVDEFLEPKWDNVDEGLSTYQIAEIVNRNPKNIYNKLKDFGIPTRSRER
jgi:hypothetical protein